MEGKIFNDSANIYQDQARVIYEYYKSSAEKIVAEEKALEENIKNTKSLISSYNLDYDKAKTNRTFGWIFCWTIVGLIVALIQNAKMKEIQAQIDNKNKELSMAEQAYKDIFRDYHVTKMGIAYVPVAKRIAFNNKSFIVDQSGVTDKEKFKLQVIKQNELLDEAVTNLKDLTKSAPIVESSTEPETINTGDLSKSIQKVNFNDYFGKLDRTLRTISYSLRNIDEYNVEIPVVFPDTKYAKFLEDHAATDISGSPIFNVFDTSQFDNEITKFNELNETRKALSSQSEQVDSVLKTLIVDMADAVQSTATKKATSAGSLVEYSNKILFNILKAPYDFYSPVLEAEEIERIKNEKFDYEQVDYNYKPFNLKDSSKVKLDLHSMSWVAEDGSRTTIPFGVNQIQSEIIAPIVSALLKDTRKERLEIYNHIKDQKLSYLNKWHQDTEDFYGRNRAEAADIINLMRSTLADYSAAYNTLAAYKKTEQTMESAQTLESAVTKTKDDYAEVIAGYQAQAEQIAQTQKDFSDYMDRLHEDIDDRAQKFGYVEYYDASLRDKKARDTAVAASTVNELDDRRKPLAEVNPLLAKDSELPPVPSVDDEAYDYVRLNLNTKAQEALDELKEVENEQIVHEKDVENESELDDDETAPEDVNEDSLEEDDDQNENEEDDDQDALDEDNEEEEGTEDGEDLTVEDIESLIESLLEKDHEDKYGVQALASQFFKAKEAYEQASDQDEIDKIENDLIDIYNKAIEIDQESSNENE